MSAEAHVQWCRIKSSAVHVSHTRSGKVPAAKVLTARGGGKGSNAKCKGAASCSALHCAPKKLEVRNT